MAGQGRVGTALQQRDMVHIVGRVFLQATKVTCAAAKEVWSAGACLPCCWLVHTTQTLVARQA